MLLALDFQPHKGDQTNQKRAGDASQSVCHWCHVAILKQLFVFIFALRFSRDWMTSFPVSRWWLWYAKTHLRPRVREHAGDIMERQILRVYVYFWDGQQCVNSSRLCIFLHSHVTLKLIYALFPTHAAIRAFDILRELRRKSCAAGWWDVTRQHHVVYRGAEDDECDAQLN